MDPEQGITELTQRLTRYPADRYPVQHATAQFHLGALLTDIGRLDDAARALDAAAALFDPDGLAVERAKVTNARGVVFRLTGRLDEAADAFEHAAAAFDAAELPLEAGAATFNLGLVHRDRDDANAAARCFRQARERFDPQLAPAEAAAAARELGATLMVTGELEAARKVLEEAVGLADRAGDIAGLGASANLLGLIHLGADRPAAAIDAFRDAVGAHPRSVRPGEHAMAKANLALGYEGVGAPDHAYLSAAQALGTSDAAAPVRQQAREILERLGERRGAVLPVLDGEPHERWPSIVREELTRWVDAEPRVRLAECGGWIDGQLARPDLAGDLAEVWLGGLLELPPESMTTLIRATLEALAERDTEAAGSFRSTMSRAVVRFPIPQWTRLKDRFNSLAAELGQEGSWG